MTTSSVSVSSSLSMPTRNHSSVPKCGTPISKAISCGWISQRYARMQNYNYFSNRTFRTLLAKRAFPSTTGFHFRTSCWKKVGNNFPDSDAATMLDHVDNNAVHTGWSNTAFLLHFLSFPKAILRHCLPFLVRCYFQLISSTRIKLIQRLGNATWFPIQCTPYLVAATLLVLLLFPHFFLVLRSYAQLQSWTQIAFLLSCTLHSSDFFENQDNSVGNRCKTEGCVTPSAREIGGNLRECSRGPNYENSGDTGASKKSGAAGRNSSGSPGSGSSLSKSEYPTANTTSEVGNNIRNGSAGDDDDGGKQRKGEDSVSDGDIRLVIGTQVSGEEDTEQQTSSFWQRLCCRGRKKSSAKAKTTDMEEREPRNVPPSDTKKEDVKAVEKTDTTVDTKREINTSMTNYATLKRVANSLSPNTSHMQGSSQFSPIGSLGALSPNTYDRKSRSLSPYRSFNTSLELSAYDFPRNERPLRTVQSFVRKPSMELHGAAYSSSIVPKHTPVTQELPSKSHRIPFRSTDAPINLSKHPSQSSLSSTLSYARAAHTKFSYREPHAAAYYPVAGIHNATNISVELPSVQTLVTRPTLPVQNRYPVYPQQETSMLQSISSFVVARR